MSRYTPELPSERELAQLKALIEDVEAIGPRHEVAGYTLISDHGNPWLRIKLHHQPVYAGMIVDFALWRENGRVYALDRHGMVDTEMLGEAW